MLSDFPCSTLFTAIVLFSLINVAPIIAPACWWPRSWRKRVSGVRKQKKIELLEIHTCLEPGGQMLFTHKWTKLETLLLYFIVMVETISSLFGKVFFDMRVRSYVQRCQYCTFTSQVKVFRWVPKLISSRTFRIYSFLFSKASFCQLFICMDWQMQEMLKSDSDSTTSNLLNSLFDGYSGFFSNLPVLF